MSKTKQMKTHFWADEWPLNQDDVDALAESIKAGGQRHPILTLKDGTIVDGRNRWLACEIAGVKPIVKVINPDGEELTDQEIFKITTDENSLRRDASNSHRAVQAARAWRRLYPDGAPTGAAAHRNKGNTAVVSYYDFALTHFKVKEVSAKKALAIVNFGNAQLERDARIGLEKAYVEYQKLKAEQRERQLKIDALMARDDCADLRDRMESGSLTIDEAVAIMMARTKEERERREAEERARQQARDTIAGFARFRPGEEAIKGVEHADRKWLKSISENMPDFIAGVHNIHAAVEAALKTNK